MQRVTHGKDHGEGNNMIYFFACGLIIGLFSGALISILFMRHRIIQYQKALIESELKNGKADIILSVWNKILDPNFTKKGKR